MTEEQTFSAKQVARRIGTDAKTFRKWLRSTSSPYPAVGQGQRYEFPCDDLPEIDKKFKAWKDHGTKLPPVNGKVSPKATTTRTRRQKHREDIEPGEHRGLPMSITQRKLSPAEFAAERAARAKARDEEYGTLDGEELTNEEIEALAITGEEIETLKDEMNLIALEELDLEDLDESQEE